MAATETFDFERDYAELVRELRAVPAAAPERLRARVRDLGEPQTRRSLRLHWPRRSVLLLAPVCALSLVLAVAIVAGVVSSSRHSSPERAAVAPAHAQAATGGTSSANKPATLTPFAPSATPDRATPVPPPNANRLQNYQASLVLRVHGADELGRRTASAMQIARSLGGYVASVEQTSSSGSPGRADLVLRVPVAEVQSALIRLSALGTVLDQHVSIRDLDALVSAQRRRILQLRIEIARITTALQQSMPIEDRLRLEFQLDAARRDLRAATGANASTLRKAALSRIELTLTTQRAAVVTPTRGRVGRAVRGAIRFLAAAGAIALAALIVVSPLLVLATIWVLGSRAWRRREERRLLAAS